MELAVFAPAIHRHAPAITGPCLEVGLIQAAAIPMGVAAVHALPTPARPMAPMAVAPHPERRNVRTLGVS